jgi:hypothetical protein
MLDIGAAHGQRAALFLDGHPSLRAVVLGSPERIAAAAPLVEHSRITRRAEDPKTAELGELEYDLVLLTPSQLRLTTAETVDLVARCARALRRTGLLVVADFFRAKRASDNGQHAAVLALFHEMTSPAGALTTDEVAAWQRAAGLEPLPAVDILPRIHTCQMARKSS